jgi:predicted HTH transcriptional regulator
MIELKDEELLLRLNNFEDTFVERKTSGDSKDWLKTIVAFANSTPTGYPAVLYIGVKNDGTPEEKPVNLDSLQKTFGEKIGEAYPTIYCLTKVLNVEGKQILAVIVPGSPDRPHFAGPSFIRKGSETVEASEEQFANLIAMRNSKAYEILKWKGKQITFAYAFESKAVGPPARQKDACVVECNQFYVTLEFTHASYSYPLVYVEVSFDTQKNRLMLVNRY